jgi:diguanylate cyclase (GGDEF)-like protein
VSAAGRGRGLLARLPGRTSREGAVPARPAYEDSLIVGRTFALLLGVSGVLMLISLALPSGGMRDAVGVAVPAALVILLSTGLTMFASRLQPHVLAAVPALGTGLIAVAAYADGPPTLGAYGLLFLWIAAAAAYLLPAPVALGHAIAAALAFALVLILLPEHRAPAIYAAVAAGTILVAGAILSGLRRREGRVVSRLERAARTDPLTGVLNRAALEESIEQELERAARSGRPLALIVLDIDGFKRVNDDLGHEHGDAALATVGRILGGTARRLDAISRLGGDEFAVLLPETAAIHGLAVAERMRRAIERSFADWAKPLTSSFGVAGFPDHGATPSGLLKQADLAMYEAKSLGGNRSSLHPSISPPPAPGLRPTGEHPAKVASLLSLAVEVDRRKGGSDDTWRASLVAGGLARMLDLSGPRAERVELAARLRDVGTISVPPSLLQRPGPLDEEEWRPIKRHPEIGARMLASADLGELREWVLCHHERPDGNGYPRGLGGDRVPLEARILAVADAYVAMQATRRWRPRFTAAEARAELLGGAGTQFDPDVAEALLRLSRQSA